MFTKRFGKIEGVTDKNYITNSSHIHVTEHINAFDKLTFELNSKNYHQVELFLM